MNSLVKTFSRFFIFAVAVLICSGVVYGGSGAAIKARMKSRLTQIEQFKNQGVLGESNTGYLVVLKSNSKAKAIAEVENKDRKLVYRAIAKSKGTNAELVGKRRARQIAMKSPKGQIIQKADGKWCKK